MRFTPLVVVLVLAGPARAVPSWETDVAPILRSHCAGCHNDADLEGGLSVETFARLRAGGEDHGDPVHPGNADVSFLIRSVEGAEKPVMPPKDEPRVPAAAVAVLRAWVAAGAPGPKRDDSILRTLSVPPAAPAPVPAPITAAAFSPDGARVAVARSGAVDLRDAVSGAVVATFEGLPDKVNAVHFSADGGQVILAGGIPGLAGTAQIRGAASGVVIREFGGHRDVLSDAELSPDGTLLATAGYDRVIKLWNPADGSLVRTIDVHKGAIFDLAWHPSGTVLASASADETVKLWRVSDGERLDTLNQPHGEMIAVHFTPDGEHIVAGGADKRIHLWKFVSRTDPALNPPLAARFAHEAAINGLAPSRDGRHLLSSADDRSLKVWSLPALELIHDFGPQPDVSPVVLADPRSERFWIARLDGGTGWVERPAAGTPATAGAAPATPPAAAPGAPEPSRPDPAALAEVEPNDTTAQAQTVTLPAAITGSIASEGEADVFQFHAKAGQELTLEVNAARAGSKLDSRLEVLDAATGAPVEQVVLQATRDSWFTFRGKDSDTSDDFRLQNWAEMELNEYLYAKGEVVKLWLYPRGPDSGFKVYPGSGRRWTYFSTPALVHALGEPAYIVAPHPPGTTPVPNGLPVFRLNFENDDDPMRRFGADSLLLFTAPRDGAFAVRLTDVRGFGGPEGFGYTLTVRDRRPEFSVSVGGRDAKVSPGSGREIVFTADRHEGFDGPIRIDATGVPPGFSLSTPVEIEAGQTTAIAVLHADPAAVAPDPAADQALRLTATATLAGQPVTRDLGNLGDLQLAPPAKVLVEITAPDGQPATPGQPLDFTIRPGQTISARVKTTRVDFPGRIELGGDDSGRNLPHGVFIDNIGLNGLLIVEGQTEREFFITASPIAAPGTRLFHLRATADDGQASRPARLTVLPRENETAGR